MSQEKKFHLIDTFISIYNEKREVEVTGSLKFDVMNYAQFFILNDQFWIRTCHKNVKFFCIE